MKFDDYYRTNNPGVYMLILDSNESIAIFGEKNARLIQGRITDRILYIGKASNLSSRIENCHLKRARTSTLRRTIAEFFNLDFIPVSGKRGLSPDNEIIVSNWLDNNTYFKICETSTVKEAELLEHDLIKQYQPPFNKRGIEL